MDPRGPYAIDEENNARKRRLKREREVLDQGRGALNLLYVNHGYLLTRGNEPEKQRAITERVRLRNLIDEVDERLRLIRSELDGLKVLGPHDPNFPIWDQEYQESLEFPQFATQGEN
jgi:hypothetical protein